MKINTPYFIIEIEWLLIIVIFITILSPKVETTLQPFFVCYLFILFHELSHVFVASIFGKNMDKFKISLSGVCVSFEKRRYEYKNKYKKNDIYDLFIYLAGPISNILLALIFRNNILIFQLNMSLAILNLIPIFPLDGYNIFKSLLQIFNVENFKIEIISDIISNIIFYLFILLSILIIIITYNPSILIFVFYLYILKKVKEKEKKNENFIKKIEYQKYRV